MVKGKKLINIYIFDNGEYERLLNDIVLPSAPNGFPVLKIIKSLRCQEDNQKNIFGKTEDLGYSDLMLERIEKYLEILEEHVGEAILFLDADVVFFENFVDDLLEKMATKDFLMQGTNSGSGCGGIMAINSNEQTLSFWREFVNECRDIRREDRAPGFPEVQINEKINDWKSKNKMSWFSFLPPEYGYFSEGCKIYHAINGGHTLIEKKAVLQFVSNLFLNKDRKNIQEFHQFKLMKKEGYNNIFSLGFFYQADHTKAWKRIELVQTKSSLYHRNEIMKIMNLTKTPLFLGFCLSWIEDKLCLYDYKKNTLIYADTLDSTQLS